MLGAEFDSVVGRQAWCDLGLASDSKNVRELATKFVSFDLVNGGIMENYLLSGCNLEMLVELVDWPECLRHLVRDYESKVLERVLGDRAGYQEDTALYTLVYNHIVRHGRVDVLRWLIFFGPSVLGLMTPPGRYPDRSGPYVGYFICRDEVRKVGERWGLDKSKLKAFDVIFDEADSLKKIHQELDVQHKAFHHLMCSGGSVAEAEACRARVAALVAQFPEGMERCSIIAEYSEMSRTALEDPVARPRNSWKSLCSAARYNHLALVKWLLEVKAARHPEGGWADSCFRAFVVSATHGAKDVAQVKAAALHGLPCGNENLPMGPAS